MCERLIAIMPMMRPTFGRHPDFAGCEHVVRDEAERFLGRVQLRDVRQRISLGRDEHGRDFGNVFCFCLPDFDHDQNLHEKAGAAYTQYLWKVAQNSISTTTTPYTPPHFCICVTCSIKVAASEWEIRRDVC
jgi:hypothetical protein